MAQRSGGGAVGCTRYTAPSGSDSAFGSADAPFKTVQQLADALSPGETGCIRGGSYAGDVNVDWGGERGQPITLRSYPGEQATLVGRFVITQGADHVIVERLVLDGRTTDGLPSPVVNADDVTFRNNDVTNGRTAICFVVGASDTDSWSGYGRATRTLIEANRIHNCGRLPATNHDHGVYVEGADDTQIVGNWIYDNADRGIQLYPDAQRTAIRANVIDGNGTGIIVSGDLDVASNDTLIEGNAISNARLRFNLESWWAPGGPIGRNNEMTRNCIWGARRDDAGVAGVYMVGGGFSAHDNTVGKPLYTDHAAKDFRLPSDSPCGELLGRYAAVTPGP